jgi:tRNA-specific 2-thiouridylase
MRIVVAMSGGVDSSVAALLLHEAGHEIVGLSMQLYDQRTSPDTGGPDAYGSCCSLDDLHDARRVASAIGFPHYVLDFEAEFQRTVVRNFVTEYASGRTPIPCVHCNSSLKFATLVERATGLGASWVATGHYAQVVYDEDRRRYALRRGADREKDQSYFLFSLTQDQLARAVFPVGGLTKTDVRRHALRRGLIVADKRDSHEICFVPDGETAAFVERSLDTPPPGGELVDSGGRVLGRHAGIHRFTVGQRKGLGLSGPTPLYVLRIEPDAARVVVGSREELGRRDLAASEVNWISGEPPDGPVRLTARVRHRHPDAIATVTPDGPARAHVLFDEPQLAVSPGQAVVFYAGDEVIGGGWIA